MTTQACSAIKSISRSDGDYGRLAMFLDIENIYY